MFGWYFFNVSHWSFYWLRCFSRYCRWSLAQLWWHIFSSTFSWLHVMCFDIWRTFRFLFDFVFYLLIDWRNAVLYISRWCLLQCTIVYHIRIYRKSTPKPFNRRVGTSFIAYSIVGWGYPFLIVLTGQVFDRVVEYRGGNNSVIIQPLFGEGQTCWFNGSPTIFLDFLYFITFFCLLVCFIRMEVDFFILVRSRGRHYIGQCFLLRVDGRSTLPHQERLGPGTWKSTNSKSHHQTKVNSYTIEKASIQLFSLCFIVYV